MMPIGLTESSITLCVLWHTSHSYSILILKEDAMAICHDQICFSFYLFYENLLHCKRFSCHGSQLRYSAKNKLWLNYFSCLGKLKIIPNFPSIKVCWTGSLGNLSFVTAFCQKEHCQIFVWLPRCAWTNKETTRKIDSECASWGKTWEELLLPLQLLPQRLENWNYLC